MVDINLEIIKSKRKQLNISQNEMAEILGFKSASTYYKYESGEYSLKANMLPIISKTLKIPMKKFFVYESSKTEQKV